MHDIGKALGARIKRIRKERKLTQDDVAVGINVSRSTYAEWEGGIEPKLSIVLKIAAFLNIQIEDLIEGLSDEFSEMKKSEITTLKEDIEMLKGLLLTEKPSEYKKVKKKTQK